MTPSIELLKQVDLEKVNQVLLRNLTKSNAAMIKFENSGWDDDKCWFEGEKSTGVWIVLKYASQCNNNGFCLPPRIPDYCDHYLNKIDITDLKRHRGYFIWAENGRQENNPQFIMDEEYFLGLHDIMSFCTHVKNRGCKKNKNALCRCPFDKNILERLDRRQSERRDLKQPRRCKVVPFPDDRRKEDRRDPKKNRRVIEHRGEIAIYL